MTAVPASVQLDRDEVAIGHMSDLWSSFGRRALPMPVVHLMTLASEMYAIAHCFAATPAERSAAASAYAGLLDAMHRFVSSPPFGAAFASADEVEAIVREWVSLMLPTDSDADDGGPGSDG
jgi:hypothetical protein